ncbi:MAG: hypothetical protein V4706_00145 [Pseudomonadota bacterium]
MPFSADVALPASQKNQFAKTNAQKKWAVKTRPFGREADILPRCARVCKQFACPKPSAAAHGSEIINLFDLL